mmetsp:Transcript_20331/g.25135  ORF Transcript_20331/g.25135 Transcript_20331/m.25135 type:complete len:347 (+) Transcript_20331:139-1179(+)
MLYCYPRPSISSRSSFVALILTVISLPAQFVFSQPLSCPPIPELADIVNTTDKCTCFNALAGSGLDLGNSLTFERAFTDDTVQSIIQTGNYYGAKGIAEYLSFVKGGTFVHDYFPIGSPIFLDMTGSSMDQCVVTYADRRRLPINPQFTTGNIEPCVDTVVGATIFYKKTGNPMAPINVQKINSWLPDAFFREALKYIVDSPATADFVCDVIVNSCRKKTGKSSKRSKTSSKSSKKKSKSIKKCVNKYNELPKFDTINGLTYLDGNSKSCRVLHSVFAETNSLHCPHVSFEAEPDVNGFVKCNESEGRAPTDLFTPETLGSFLYAAKLLGLDASGVKIQVGGRCSA